MKINLNMSNTLKLMSTTIRLIRKKFGWKGNNKYMTLIIKI